MNLIQLSLLVKCSWHMRSGTFGIKDHNTHLKKSSQPTSPKDHLSIFHDCRETWKHNLWKQNILKYSFKKYFLILSKIFDLEKVWGGNASGFACMMSVYLLWN